MNFMLPDVLSNRGQYWIFQLVAIRKRYVKSVFRYEIYEKNRFRFHSFNDALYNFLDELIGFGKPPTDILAIQST